MKNDPTNLPNLSIVLPVFNEEPTLHEMFRQLLSILTTLEISYEILFIDDGSTDGTWDVIKDLSDRMAVVRAIRLSRNFGKEMAVIAGLEEARGKAAIIMDADLQHPPELIPEMVRLWKAGFRVVEGVKANRGKEPLTNRLGATLYYWIMNRLIGFPFHSSSDFKLLDRKVIEALKTMGERSRLFRGMVGWVGFRRATIPFSVKERVGGSSHWSKRKLFRLAINTITSFSSFPLHLVTLMGVFTLVFSMVIGFHTVCLKWTGQAVSGFATVILLLLFMNGVLMVSLGIIGEYIARIYDEVKRRPFYFIEERLEKPLGEETTGYNGEKA